MWRDVERPRIAIEANRLQPSAAVDREQREGGVGSALHDLQKELRDGGGRSPENAHGGTGSGNKAGSGSRGAGDDASTAAWGGSGGVEADPLAILLGGGRGDEWQAVEEVRGRREGRRERRWWRKGSKEVDSNAAGQGRY
jgi:hypothetical protein